MNNILGPDGRTYDPERPIVVPCGVQMGAVFRCRLFDKFSGKTRIQTPWQHNLLLDVGLEQWGEAVDLTFLGVKVGAGNTTPNVTQSALDSYLGVNDTTESRNLGNAQDAALDYYSFTRFIWRFNAGNATGVIAELGPTWDKNTGTGDKIMSRELIRDGAGDPTTINKGVNEILDVDYEIRGYQNPVDVVLPGQIINSVSTEVTIRPSDINSAADRAVDYAMGNFTRSSGVSSGFQCYDGEIQDILNEPSGSQSSNTSRSWSAYSPASLQADVATFYDQDQGNFGPGIGAAKYRTNVGSWQIGFNPHIFKLATQNLTLNYRLNWARKTIV